MAVTLHANNAVGYLLTPVAPSDTTIVLQAGQGARFPSIVPGEQFFVTVENRAVAGSMEIMLCTARTLDSLVVLRGQQGTTAISFAAGVSVSNRVTAEFLNDFDARIEDASDTAGAAAIAAGTALAAADAANAGLALKANLAGPTTFTGVISAPTAAPGTNTTQLATTSFVTAAVAAGGGGGGGGVPVDSPVFTGNPTAPTPAPGDNDTSLATTAFVTAAVTQGVTGLAPLASPALTGVPTAPTAAGGSNTTQVATTAFVTSGLALKANIDGPTFTGVPSAPTATAGANTTQLATTAFVTAAVAAGGGGGGGAPDPAVWATLASPALTGVPTAPTAVSGTNTTQLATTAFVTTAVATLAAASAPLASPTFSGDPKVPTAPLSDNDTSIANTAWVTTAIASKADLAGPTFTGIPKADTAAPGTSTVQLATTAFVTLALAGVPNPAIWAPLASPALTGTPTTPNVTQGVSNTQIANTAFVTIGLAAKVSAASPALTGVPTAPTAAAGTSTTQIATTAFVTTALGAKANLDSPAFINTPTAPTPAPGISNTQIATTAFVTGATSAANVVTTLTGMTSAQASAVLGGWGSVMSSKIVTWPIGGGAPSNGDVLIARIPSGDSGVFEVSTIPAASALASPNTSYGVTAAGAPVARSPADQAEWELQAATVADGTIGIDVATGGYVQRTPTAQTAKMLAASTTVSGRIEIATGTETTTGTDATRAVSPDGLRASNFGCKEVAIDICDSDTFLTVGDGKVGLPIPFTMEGMLIVSVRVMAHTASTGTGSNDFQVRRRRAGVNVDVLTTKVTLSAGEFSVADGAISATNGLLAGGDMLYPDVDALTATLAPKGVSMAIVARLPTP